ncbi:MAG: AI-2E family transporter [Clostridia bacterium]|nr:AI-2E family transporter [Clostridia bacterium]
MKIDWNKKYTTVAVYAIIVILVALFAVFLFFNFSEAKVFVGKINKVFKPLVYGLAFAYILWPITEFFQNKVFRFDKNAEKPHFKLKRALSIVCAYLCAAAIITLFVLSVIPQISESYKDLQSKFYTYVGNTENWILRLVEDNAWLNGVYDKIAKAVDEFASDLAGITKTVVPQITTLISGIVVEIVNILMGFVIAFYLLISKEKLIAQVKKLTRCMFSEKNYAKLSHIAVLSDNKFGRYIIGKIIDSIILGIICFVVMWIIRIPYAPLVSVIVATTNVIPIVGPYIGGIPCALIIFIANPVAALEFIIMDIVLQEIESNIIEPKIIGSSIGLSALWVIVSITVMGALFGVLGMFISVPVFAVLYDLVKTSAEEKLKAEALPVSTEDYYSDRDIAALYRPRPKKEKQKRRIKLPKIGKKRNK